MFASKPYKPQPSTRTRSTSNADQTAFAPIARDPSKRQAAVAATRRIIAVPIAQQVANAFKVRRIGFAPERINTKAAAWETNVARGIVGRSASSPVTTRGDPLLLRPPLALHHPPSSSSSSAHINAIQLANQAAPGAVAFVLLTGSAPPMGYEAPLSPENGNAQVVTGSDNATLSIERYLVTEAALTGQKSVFLASRSNFEFDAVVPVADLSQSEPESEAIAALSEQLCGNYLTRDLLPPRGGVDGNHLPTGHSVLLLQPAYNHDHRDIFSSPENPLLRSICKGMLIHLLRNDVPFFSGVGLSAFEIPVNQPSPPNSFVVDLLADGAGGDEEVGDAAKAQLPMTAARKVAKMGVSSSSSSHPPIYGPSRPRVLEFTDFDQLNELCSAVVEAANSKNVAESSHRVFILQLLAKKHKSNSNNNKNNSGELSHAISPVSIAIVQLADFAVAAFHKQNTATATAAAATTISNEGVNNGRRSRTVSDGSASEAQKVFHNLSRDRKELLTYLSFAGSLNGQQVTSREVGIHAPTTLQSNIASLLNFYCWYRPDRCRTALLTLIPSKIDGRSLFEVAGVSAALFYTDSVKRHDIPKRTLSAIEMRDVALKRWADREQRFREQEAPRKPWQVQFAEELTKAAANSSASSPNEEGNLNSNNNNRSSTQRQQETKERDDEEDEQEEDEDEKKYSDGEFVDDGDDEKQQQENSTTAALNNKSPPPPSDLSPQPAPVAADSTGAKKVIFPKPPTKAAVFATGEQQRQPRAVATLGAKKVAVAAPRSLPAAKINNKIADNKAKYPPPQQQLSVKRTVSSTVTTTTNANAAAKKQQQQQQQQKQPVAPKKPASKRAVAANPARKGRLEQNKTKQQTNSDGQQQQSRPSSAGSLASNKSTTISDVSDIDDSLINPKPRPPPPKLEEIEQGREEQDVELLQHKREHAAHRQMLRKVSVGLLKAKKNAPTTSRDNSVVSVVDGSTKKATSDLLIDITTKRSESPLSVKSNKSSRSTSGVAAEVDSGEKKTTTVEDEKQEEEKKDTTTEEQQGQNQEIPVDEAKREENDDENHNKEQASRSSSAARSEDRRRQELEAAANKSSPPSTSQSQRMSEVADTRQHEGQVEEKQTEQKRPSDTRSTNRSSTRSSRSRRSSSIRSTSEENNRRRRRSISESSRSSRSVHSRRSSARSSSVSDRQQSGRSSISTTVAEKNQQSTPKEDITFVNVQQHQQQQPPPSANDNNYRDDFEDEEVEQEQDQKASQQQQQRQDGNDRRDSNREVAHDNSSNTTTVHASAEANVNHSGEGSSSSDHSNSTEPYHSQQSQFQLQQQHQQHQPQQPASSIEQGTVGVITLPKIQNNMDEELRKHQHKSVRGGFGFQGAMMMVEDEDEEEKPVIGGAEINDEMLDSPPIVDL